MVSDSRAAQAAAPGVLVSVIGHTMLLLLLGVGRSATTAPPAVTKSVNAPSFIVENLDVALVATLATRGLAVVVAGRPAKPAEP